MTQQGLTRVERLLGSARGRVLVTLALVAVVSLVTTVPHIETADLRGRDVHLGEIYFEQFVVWAFWGALAWPMTAGASRLLGKTGSWPALVAVMVPVSLVTSYAFLQLDYYLHKPSQAEVEAWVQEWRQLREERREEHRAEWRTEQVSGPGGARPETEEFGARRGPGPRRAGRPGEGNRELMRGNGPGPPRDWPPSFERQRNRWRAMRAGMERPDLSYVHWRFRWIQNALIFWALLGMGGGLLSFLRLQRKERLAAELELRASKLRGELVHAQLDTLKGQLQPHFLFNALHSVGGLIRSGEQQQALRTLSAIGQLLRSTLDLGGDAEVRLEDELRIARRYVEIEQIRFGERLRVEIDSDERLAGALIPSLLLLPLVENAVKYGIAPRTQGGRLWIRARRVGEQLELVVRDDGEGFPAQVLNGEASGAARSSIGLENTRGRLVALYGSAQELEVRNASEGGAEVRVTLPYHNEPLGEPPTGSDD